MLLYKKRNTIGTERGEAGNYLKLLHEQQQANPNVSKTLNASAKIFTVAVVWKKDDDIRQTMSVYLFKTWPLYDKRRVQKPGAFLLSETTHWIIMKIIMTVHSADRRSDVCTDDWWTQGTRLYSQPFPGLCTYRHWEWCHVVCQQTQRDRERDANKSTGREKRKETQKEALTSVIIEVSSIISASDDLLKFLKSQLLTYRKSIVRYN